MESAAQHSVTCPQLIETGETTKSPFSQVIMTLTQEEYVQLKQEYWLVDADKLSIDCFTKQKDDSWILYSYSFKDDLAEVVSLGVKIQLSDLYDQANI